MFWLVICMRLSLNVGVGLLGFVVRCGLVGMVVVGALCVGLIRGGCCLCGWFVVTLLVVFVVVRWLVLMFRGLLVWWFFGFWAPWLVICWYGMRFRFV